MRLRAHVPQPKERLLAHLGRQLRGRRKQVEAVVPALYRRIDRLESAASYIMRRDNTTKIKVGKVSLSLVEDRKPRLCRVISAGGVVKVLPPGRYTRLQVRVY